MRNKQITPGEVRAGLLLPEASCSWSLPFPSSPGIASNLCPGRDVLSRAVPPMLVVQSLASSHVSMVIVAGDPLTATNSKKREEKKKKVLIFLCISQGLVEGCAPSLRCCDCSVVTAAGTLSSDPCSPSRAERDAQGACCACRTYFSTLSVMPQRLLLQTLRKMQGAPLPVSSGHTLLLLRAKVRF